MGRERMTGFTSARPLIPLAYRVEDAAAVIGISRATLYELIQEGVIPSRKVGATTIIRHVDLDAFLNATPLSPATKRAQSFKS